MTLPSDSVLEPVVAQHADEAAFLWFLRVHAARAPHYFLAELAELDERVEAHLDGLRVAGDHGWEICKRHLAWEEAGEVFTGALLALESGDPLRIEEVLAVADQSIELARGAISALGWVSYERAYSCTRDLLGSDNPVRRRIAIGALAAHRQDPGPVLAEEVRESAPSVRARALKAVGELGRYDLLSDCRTGLEHGDEACRFWAAWSGAIMGDGRAIDALLVTADAGGPEAEPACELAMRRLEPSQSLRWQRHLANRPESLRLAIQAASAIGDPVLIPWLLQLMAVSEHARVAGEAFSTVTGADLEQERLDAKRPEGFEAGPTEDPEDENVDMDPDENLPWPDPDRIARWWSQNGGRFTPGVRYLLGQPITPESLVHALRTGKQRQRASAALEIAFRRPGKPLFEVRARGDWQRRMLGI